MNGRDTSAAMAMFFALLSLGLLLKLDDVAVSVGGATVCALMSALMTKKAVMQTASEIEDNIGRIEVQFQQLRSKMSGEQVDLLSRQNRLIEGISNKINTFEQPTNQEDRLSDELKSTLDALVESSKSMILELETFNERLDNQLDQSKLNTNEIVKELSGVSEKFSELSEQNAKLVDKLEGLQSVVTTGVKLVQVMGQLVKNPPFSKDLNHLNESTDGVKDKLGNIHETIIEHGKTVDDVMNGVRENMMGMTFQFDKSLGEFGEQIKALTAEVEKLVERIDAYNGLTKATLDQYSMLTEQDVRVLEDLTRKLEVKS